MILEIINKKRLGQELSEEELKKIFNGYLNGEVADYQMSSLLMAICINGMSDEEIFSLTKIFIESGETLDFSNIPGIKVDKHSTGGIGDKRKSEVLVKDENIEVESRRSRREVVEDLILEVEAGISKLENKFSELDAARLGPTVHIVID